MMDVGTVSSVITSGATVLGGALYLGRAIVSHATTVKENTAATRQLAEEFRRHRADVERRLTRLEHVCGL